MLRLSQRGEQRPAGVFKIRVRPVRNHAGDDIRRRLGFHLGAELQTWEPRFTVKDFIGGEGPIVGKNFLQFRDDRPGHAEVKVLNRVRRFCIQHISMPDVHAAGESRFTIHDE